MTLCASLVERILFKTEPKHCDVHHVFESILEKQHFLRFFFTTLTAFYCS